MLIDVDQLDGQLSDVREDTVRTIYLLLAHAKLPGAMTVRPSGHGYISRELRFEFGNTWLYSAVLNQSWTLWYFRRPALSKFSVKPEQLLEIFPQAKVTSRGEVSLRLRDLKTVYSVLGWVSQNC